MEPPFVRSPYNYDVDEASNASGLKCEDKSRTQQHFKEECDINTIVERFGLTGEVPSGVAVPMQGDFTEVYDFQSAMDVVIGARQAFEQMPANVRKRFGNDPALFMEFVHDPENVEEAKKLGLLVKVEEAKVVAAAPAAAVQPAAQPAAAVAPAAS